MARMTTTSNANLLLDVFHANTFIEALRDTVIALKYGKRQEAPRNSGKVIRWQYFSNPAAVTTPLSEGGDPTTPRDLSTTAVTATMQEYGDYFEHAKVFISTAASGTMQEINKAAGYQAGISLDTLCYTLALQDATNIEDSGAAMTIDKWRVAVYELHSNAARPHPATPGGRYYAALISSEAYFDMIGEGTPKWSDVKDENRDAAYGNPLSATLDTRAGYGCYFELSQNIQVASSEDLNYLLANEAFGVVSLDSDVMDPRVITIMPEERTDKPLKNSGTTGWWVYWAAEMLNANSLVEIKSDVTA